MSLTLESLKIQNLEDSYHWCPAPLIWVRKKIVQHINKHNKSFCKNFKSLSEVGEKKITD